MTCCSHRALDHVYRGGQPKHGAACTVPGCKCAGWIPRKKAGRLAPEPAVAAKVVSLHREGLLRVEIRERLGLSANFIRETLRGAGL